MKTIVLKKLALVNFKGISSLELAFSCGDTLVSGDNGTGKTTVFDAFTWLLFGKDSTGRSDSNFNIKTLDAAGKPMLRLEHSVSCWLDVDGREVKLQRTYKEVWTKPRGTTEETLSNHKTEFYINDVKLGTKKEYEAEIAAIIDEDVFRMITNPFAFNLLPADRQRDMLLDLAGSVTDADVLAKHPEFAALMAEVAAKPLATFMKEVAAKKRACKEVLAVVPSQIETAKNLMPEQEDWKALQAEVEANNAEQNMLDEQIADRSKVNEQEFRRKAEIQKAIGDKRMALANVQNAIKVKATEGRMVALQAVREKEYQIEAKNRELEQKKGDLMMLGRQIDDVKEEIERKRAEYRSLFVQEISFSEDQFVCPTCKRPLDMDDIEQKQAELRANFNTRKSHELKRIQQEGIEANAKCKALTDERERLEKETAEISTVLTSQMNEVARMKAEVPEQVNVDEIIMQDAECIALQNEITDLQNQSMIEVKDADVTDLRERRRILNDKTQVLYRRLAQRDQIARTEQEIHELEEKQASNSQMLADMEKWEFEALSFQKAKDEELLSRINGLFRLVSFSFVSQQLNGGEKTTCVCTVNGTPYPDVNNAGKINAGLDIINAICTIKGVSAPIFVDNAESVNDVIDTVSQKVLLYVGKEPQLTIREA